VSIERKEMREKYTGHYEVNTYPDKYTEDQELIRKNFIALNDSRKNHGEWLEHLEELVLVLAANTSFPHSVGKALKKYNENMDNL